MLVVDGRGRFTATGTFVREHGGPIRDAERPDSPQAMYSGTGAPTVVDRPPDGSQRDNRGIRARPRIARPPPEVPRQRPHPLNEPRSIPTHSRPPESPRPLRDNSHRMPPHRFLFVSLDGLIGDTAWTVAKEGNDVRYSIDN
jgi:hypothetical protein